MGIGSGWIEMADSEPTHDNPRNMRNLPAIVPPGEVARPASENWLLRAVRTLFGWKAGSVRDDLQVVLDASQPDEVGFTAVERTMLRNILSLHERRLADVMVHRADIIAVKRDIPLGELMDLFESPRIGDDANAPQETASGGSRSARDQFGATACRGQHHPKAALCATVDACH